MVLLKKSQRKPPKSQRFEIALFESARVGFQIARFEAAKVRGEGCVKCKGQHLDDLSESILLACRHNGHHQGMAYFCSERKLALVGHKF